jgi:phosphate uptake regulator
LWQGKQDEKSRKVQFTGGSTYIISLPKKWISQNQIEKGSFIKLREEEGGLLTIVPPAPIIQKRLDEAFIKVVPTDSSEKITRKMVSAYLAGYNTIHIKADKQPLSSKQRHNIKDFVRYMLVGTEIVNDTSAQLALQVLLSYPELTIQSSLRRMTIITKLMHNDAISSLKSRDLQVKDVISTDNEVDRFNLYITRLLKIAVYNPRIIKEIGLVNTDDCLGYRIVTKYVERTADHAVKIAENSLTLNHALNQDIIQRIEKMSNFAIGMFDTAMESLFKQDYDAAENVIQNIQEVANLEKEAITFSQADTEDGSTLRLIIESIKRTAEYACDIGEIVLNLTIDSTLV